MKQRLAAVQAYRMHSASGRVVEQFLQLHQWELGPRHEVAAVPAAQATKVAVGGNGDRHEAVGRPDNEGKCLGRRLVSQIHILIGLDQGMLDGRMMIQRAPRQGNKVD
ncbi:MAG: hypothetical protein NTY38_26615 [Acidobacteria bacterium]|nr:hypothetical protein [Acidobacteriota bacterium]